jgi:hypothetical protein
LYLAQRVHNRCAFGRELLDRGVVDVHLFDCQVSGHGPRLAKGRRRLSKFGVVEPIVDELIAPERLVCEKRRSNGLLLLPRVLALIVVRVRELGVVLCIVSELSAEE